MSAMTYKGQTARVEYSDVDQLFVGRLLGIADVVGFHADSVAGLRAAFEEAVDDYLETCARTGSRHQSEPVGHPRAATSRQPTLNMPPAHIPRRATGS